MRILILSNDTAYAKKLKNSKVLFVQTALQDQVNQVGEPYIVELKKFSKAA